MRQLSDAALVLRCLEGDKDAFGELVRRYESAVYATAHYYVGRYGVAEDVAQESLWAAYRGLRRLRDPNRLGAWLREITTRTAANWLRKNRSRLLHETPPPHRRTISIEDVRKGPDVLLQREELYARLSRAIDTLPERYRLPVMLRYLQELSYEEISQFTGESRDEIRGILHRASRQLREVLQDDDDNEEGHCKWPRVHK
ncbi:MAG: sigma-70 family RNA polymerase sigma factor [Candidatus Hydrogenedentes bacterium]|nr:sigma-70 family RNA polymerase sigma factor [Candidatus Hydrogenedentota bacterium]